MYSLFPLCHLMKHKCGLFSGADWQRKSLCGEKEMIVTGPTDLTFSNCATALSSLLPDSPLSLGGESLGFVVAGCGGDDFIPVFVNSAGLCGCQLRLLLGLLLNFCNLLSLLRGGRDLHAQDDVSDL